MEINGRFRFHSVGQGLFYSGILNSDSTKKPFSFVYDCGTESNRDFLYREIDDFKELLPRFKSSSNKRFLNLLVISHFHDDHVNGVEYLLRDVIVDTVVIPYMKEDLVLLARLESKKTEVYLDEFYRDAIGWLVSHGVRRILVTGSEEYEEFENNDQYPTENETNEFEDLSIPQESILFRRVIDKTTLLYLSQSSIVDSSVYKWRFIFRNVEIPRMRPYVNVVEEFMKSQLVTISDILKSKELTRKLKKKIKEVLPNGRQINQTSVVLIHMPAYWSGYPIRFVKTSHFSQGVEGYEKYRPATILTGDIEEINNMQTLFIDEPHIVPYSLFILQIPHHGSKTADLIKWDEVRYSKYITSVVSYGIINNYGHPSNIVHQYRNPVLVNERESFDYYIILGH